MNEIQDLREFKYLLSSFHADLKRGFDTCLDFQADSFFSYSTKQLPVVEQLVQKAEAAVAADAASSDSHFHLSLQEKLMKKKLPC